MDSLFIDAGVLINIEKNPDESKSKAVRLKTWEMRVKRKN